VDKKPQDPLSDLDGVPDADDAKRLSQLESHLADEQKKRKETERQLASARRIIEEQQQRLENLHNAKFKIPTSRPTTAQGSFCRVAIPDTHGCFVEPDAIAAFLSDLEALRPAEVVMLGDHLDCGGFLAEHWTFGYVAEMEYTFEEDVSAANQLLDAVQRIVPEAAIHYIEGNHERRIEKWCVTQGLKHRAPVNRFLSMFSPAAVLHLEKRNIQHYQQGKFYGGLPIPATIKLGHCHFTHGSRTGVHAAKMHLQDFGGNVVFGHTHRSDSHTTRSVNEGTIGGWSSGCLCKLQPYWNHTQITGWSHGYGLQLVDKDGGFLHVNVPIIDGKSYLVPLVEKLA